MFFLLRSIVIVGVIFYYSPVRQTAEWSGGPGPESRLDALWEKLPETAKRSLLERVAASLFSGGRTAREGAPPPWTDTLEPEDFRPAWKGAAALP
jgi:hypothetical protein